MAQLSLLGLYNIRYDILDGMQLPAVCDRETLVENLLMECAELEILYPNPDFLKFAVEMWSKKQIGVWNKLAATLNLEYNPIENYRRSEEWDDTAEVSGNSSTTSTQNGSGSTKVAGFNAADLVDNYSETQSVTGESQNATSSNSTAKRKGVTFGNIGVTTSQQMIEEERRVSLFNLYDVIISDFKRRFCLLVY